MYGGSGTEYLHYRMEYLIWPKKSRMYYTTSMGTLYEMKVNNGFFKYRAKE